MRFFWSLDLRWRLEAEEDAQRFHQADPLPFPPGTVTPNAGEK